MSRAFMWAFLLALVVASAGCASNEIPDMDQDPEMRKISSSAPEPLGLRLAVAPIYEDFDRKEINQEGTNRWSVRTDLDELRSEFVDVLGRYSVFEEVGTVDGQTMEQCIDAAFEKEYDLVMDLRLNRFDVHYEGVTGWYAPNLINFAMFIWTAWWVTDEIYGGNVELDMRLYSAHSGKQVFLPEIIDKTELRELDDFERGWKLTGSIFIPGNLEADNWQKIHKVVMPFALRKTYRQMLEELNENFYGKVIAPTGTFADEMAKTMALVVGVSRHEDYLIHNLRYADKDAEAFAAFLQDRARCDIPAKNVKAFQNHTATLQGFRDTFENFIRKYCREDDTVIIYFAGYGAVEPSEGTDGDGYKKYLLMADTKVDQLADTALSLDDLDALCDSLPAKNVVFFLDTSWNQFGETRTYQDVRTPPQDRTLAEDFLKKLVDQPGRVVVAACDPNQGALMLDEEQHGLLTHYFLANTDPEAAQTDQPYLTLSMIFDAARPDAEDRADIEGTPQTPMLLGEEVAKTINLVSRGVEEAPAAPKPEEAPEPEEAPGG